MPIYEWSCPKCGAREETYCPVKERKAPKCCAKPMEAVISLAGIIPDIAPYRSVATGEVIGGRRQHREHLKRHGLIEVGNERLKPRKPVPLPPLAEDIRQAIHQVKRR